MNKEALILLILVLLTGCSSKPKEPVKEDNQIEIENNKKHNIKIKFIKTDTTKAKKHISITKGKYDVDVYTLGGLVTMLVDGEEYSVKKFFKDASLVKELEKTLNDSVLDVSTGIKKGIETSNGATYFHINKYCYYITSKPIGNHINIFISSTKFPENIDYIAKEDNNFDSKDPLTPDISLNIIEESDRKNQIKKIVDNYYSYNGELQVIINGEDFRLNEVFENDKLKRYFLKALEDKRFNQQTPKEEVREDRRYYNFGNVFLTVYTNTADNTEEYIFSKFDNPKQKKSYLDNENAEQTKRQEKEKEIEENRKKRQEQREKEGK